jgi:hypothetical protein
MAQGCWKLSANAHFATGHMPGQRGTTADRGSFRSASDRAHPQARQVDQRAAQQQPVDVQPAVGLHLGEVSERAVDNRRRRYGVVVVARNQCDGASGPSFA